MQDMNEMTLDIAQDVHVRAPIDKVYESLVRRLTVESTGGNNTPMPMVLEPWPGGRWFRDLGDQQGHLWGFVQVIKPPKLIEIHGPMFMSYAVVGHIQFSLAETEEGTQLSLRHRAVGMIDPNHREGVTHGWGAMLEDIRKLAE